MRRFTLPERVNDPGCPSVPLMVRVEPERNDPEALSVSDHSAHASVYDPVLASRVMVPDPPSVMTGGVVSGVGGGGGAGITFTVLVS